MGPLADIMPGVAPHDLAHIMEWILGAAMLTTAVGVVAQRRLARRSIGSQVALVAVITHTTATRPTCRPMDRRASSRRTPRPATAVAATATATHATTLTRLTGAMLAAAVGRAAAITTAPVRSGSRRPRR